ncbi:hypothetical protein BAC2_01332 [uncultured bacterium]|nr:hypothetical protein BAC2_01332 [uncultured bacterium]
MASDLIVNEDALEFINDLSGTLVIELTEPAQPIGGLLNLAAPDRARIASLHLETEVYDPDTEESRPLTEAELAQPVFRGPEIRLRGESGLVVSHHAPDGQQFTVRTLLAAVEATERQSRGATEWLGGVDVHHIYFEGLEPCDDGSWEISWGS